MHYYKEDIKEGEEFKSKMGGQHRVSIQEKYRKLVRKNELLREKKQ